MQHFIPVALIVLMLTVLTVLAGCSETPKPQPRVIYRLPTAQEESQIRIAAAQERIAAAIEQENEDRDRRRRIDWLNEQNRKNGLGIPPIPNW